MLQLFRIILCLSVVLSSNFSVESAESNRSVPILYTTDLYHPHEDPDDHFDLATLFAMPEFDIRAIVIDRGEGGANRAGIVPLKQMFHITGRKVPYALGLTGNLYSDEDTARGEFMGEQAGVELILNTLRETREPITIFTTGSLRDMAAAYNREPDLFRKNVSRFYMNAGHSSGREEWNVKLDPHAFVRILRSDLPIYWEPCFGDRGYSSYWNFVHGEVLESCPLPLQNYFVYALTKADPFQRDPIQSLSRPIPEDVKERIWKMKRNMWCTGAFLHAAGRPHPTFQFKKVPVTIKGDSVTEISQNGGTLEINTFYREDAEAYSEAMCEALKEILKKVDVEE